MMIRIGPGEALRRRVLGVALVAAAGSISLVSPAAAQLVLRVDSVKVLDNGLNMCGETKRPAFRIRKHEPISPILELRVVLKPAPSPAEPPPVLRIELLDEHDQLVVLDDSALVVSDTSPPWMWDQDAREAHQFVIFENRQPHDKVGLWFKLRVSVASQKTGSRTTIPLHFYWDELKQDACKPFPEQPGGPNGP